MRLVNSFLNSRCMNVERQKSPVPAAHSTTLRLGWLLDVVGYQIYGSTTGVGDYYPIVRTSIWRQVLLFSSLLRWRHFLVRRPSFRSSRH